MESKTASAIPDNIPAKGSKISEVFREESGRLLSFVRQRVSRLEDAEDIVQDVFYELSEMERLMKPVEQFAAWLFAVARNKITDRYRKKKPVLMEELSAPATDASEDAADLYLMDSLLAPDFNEAETSLFREALLEALEEALDTLPDAQRDVFVWHELEGVPFKTIAEKTGVPVNTLLTRKRYAVLQLREQLRVVYDEWLND
ncbi:MAG: RNA polymerase sigma factor [Saprospiraceae bacterium]|nr:RNA polymerase sigma factor [Saprospiraceae bacterium]